MWVSCGFLGCGSSPRVWGAREGLTLQNHQRRLIPTCVGSTETTPPANQASAAHPHVCGEHSSPVAWGAYFLGSSPRVWGALNCVVDAVQAGRLIPTCVGSTPQHPTTAAHAPAHPHVCGEHRIRYRRCPPTGGSSPRVWGALLAWLAGEEWVRLIPTCVGSTTHPKIASTRKAAHPHVCGEHPVRSRPPKGS